MMRLSKLALLALAAFPVPAFATEPASPPAKTQDKPQQERVHLGSASVTVVDEHEAVDDVITRIRTGKSEAGHDNANDAKKPAQGGQANATPAANKDNGRASLRAARGRTTAGNESERRKDERRERAATARAHSEQKRR